MAKPKQPDVTRPLADRRYLKRGPFIPYRGAEVLLLFLDLLVIFFGVKAVESYHSRTKGDRMIADAIAEESAARKAEAEMIAFRTARRDTLLIVKEDVLAARHADSLAVADLDTAIVETVAEIEAVRAEFSRVSGQLATTDKERKEAMKDRNRAENKLAPALAETELVRLQLEAIQDTIKMEWPKIQEAEGAYAVALSRRPEVVVPKTSSASVGPQVAQGNIYATVGVGRALLNVGRGQLGLSGLAGFGPDRTSVSGGGLFFNIPVISRASLDIGSGATILVEEDGATETSPYLAGSLRYALSPGRRIFLLGDSRVSHDRVWTGVGIGFGRR